MHNRCDVRHIFYIMWHVIASKHKMSFPLQRASNEYYTYGVYLACQADVFFALLARLLLITIIVSQMIEPAYELEYPTDHTVVQIFFE